MIGSWILPARAQRWINRGTQTYKAGKKAYDAVNPKLPPPATTTPPATPQKPPQSTSLASDPASVLNPHVRPSASVNPPTHLKTVPQKPPILPGPGGKVQGSAKPKAQPQESMLSKAIMLLVTEIRHLIRTAAWSQAGKHVVSGAKHFLEKTTAGKKLAQVGVKSYGLMQRGAAAIGLRGAGAAAGAAAGAGAATGTAAAITGLIGLATGIGIAVLAIGAMVASVRKVSDALQRQADELQEYSGAIAATRAMIEAREMANKIERGQKIGAEVAQVEATKARMQEAMYDIQTEILSTLSEFAPVIEVIGDSITAGLRGVDVIVNVLQTILGVVSAGTLANPVTEAKETIKAVDKFVTALGDIFVENKVGGDDQINAILNADPLARFRGQPGQNANPVPPLRPGGGP